MTLEELNAADRDGFVGAVGWVFEHSPWVAEQAWARHPFTSLETLHGAMVEAMAAADLPAQLALLRAHPDLGTRARISDASTGEQAGAGLDSLTSDEFERLQRLNREYRRKFDFPFLFAVKGATRHEVLAALERRLPADRGAEFAEALRQVARIARFRLESMLSPSEDRRG
jgi:2-oxo-4-hydroxy-4-carboxy-5-ureidoimidazoline decarboxylase